MPGTNSDHTGNGSQMVSASPSPMKSSNTAIPTSGNNSASTTPMTTPKKKKRKLMLNKKLKTQSSLNGLSSVESSPVKNSPLTNNIDSISSPIKNPSPFKYESPIKRESLIINNETHKISPFKSPNPFITKTTIPNTIPNTDVKTDTVTDRPRYYDDLKGAILGKKRLNKNLDYDDEYIEPTLDQINDLRRLMTKKLNSRSTDGLEESLLYKLDEEFNQLYTMCENTISYNEGKSCLLIGPRGSGKTTLINNVLKKLKSKYPNGFFTIKINGIFHDDDRTAVKEIARQLDWNLMYIQKNQKSNNNNNLSSNNNNDTVGDDDDLQIIGEKNIDTDKSNSNRFSEVAFEKRSITETMKGIMSILDKSKLQEEEIDKINRVQIRKNKSALNPNSAAQANKVRKLQVTTTHIPIIFIIEEFDRYTNNSKQTLLYNLFDVAQASSTSPISIIGVSTKTTVREQLEKRVKSRFSQRVIKLNKFNKLQDYYELVRRFLVLDDTNRELKKFGQYGKDYNKYINKVIFKETESLKSTSISSSSNGYDIQNSDLKKIIIKNFYTIKDINFLKNEIIKVYNSNENFIEKGYPNFTMNNPSNNKGQILINYNEFEINFKIIENLSELEIQLLICCTRIKLKNEINTINFNQCFNEYNHLINITIHQNQSKFSSVDKLENVGLVNLNKNWSKDVIIISFEKLIKLSLLIEYNRRILGNGFGYISNNNNGGANSSTLNESGSNGSSSSSAGSGSSASSGTASAIAASTGELNKIYLVDVTLEEIKNYFHENKNLKDKYDWFNQWCRL
ncbi:hypothetical protein B5S32_g2931 [[Candida] boidinii]|nr:hypothetical protein B5S32_g2931 [[Candida] boidinii]